MRKYIPLLIVAACIIGIAAIAAVPLHRNPTTYQYFSGTSGGASTTTLTKAASSFVINNTDTTVTNTFSVKLNGTSNNAIILGGGERLKLDDTDGFIVTSFTVTAVVGTPAYKGVALELP